MYYTISDQDEIIDGMEKEYVLRIKDLETELRPREKIIKNGSGALETYELLAIILNTGSKKEEVLSMSKRLLKESPKTGITVIAEQPKWSEEQALDALLDM